MRRILVSVIGIVMLAGLALIAEPKPKSGVSGSPAVAKPETSVADGERRYRANCSRCHQAPPKFSPAAMGTVMRHMRVRALITDEDMHAILKFMTQ